MKLTYFSYFSWILPFLCFLLGYAFMSSRYPLKELEVPHVVGKQIKDIIKPISSQNLNIRIVTEKEDPHLPDGTIIQQTPQPGQKVKPYQSIFLVISKQPNPLVMPQVVGVYESDIIKQLKEQGLHATYCKVPSYKPIGMCIAQSPQAHAPIQEPITIYISQGNERPVIMPDFRGHTADEIIEFLQLYPNYVSYEFIHHGPTPSLHRCSSCIVVDQRPLPGSILTMNKDKPLYIQLLTHL
jgi:beta-lactam-binding protein with PASTA domain